MSDIQLMEGNEAIAEAAIRCRCDGYFGYPITPQSEILEYLSRSLVAGKTDMAIVQAESELAAISMVFGAASAGKKVMTTSSSPGISLMQEAFSYLAAGELPCLLVNVARGGPGLGTIQPAQSDYFQSVKGGGHGDYKIIVLAPYSVQEMFDFVNTGFDLAFKYRNPVLILTDGLIGQMMEKVSMSPFEEKPTQYDTSWAATGKTPDRKRNLIYTLNLDSDLQEQHVNHLQEKYQRLKKEIVKFEKLACDDAEYLFIAYGSSARICEKTVELARQQGIKVGLLRPITLFPFPENEIREMAQKMKVIISVEMSMGQMVEDVRLAVEGRTKVLHFGRAGGAIHSPEEVLEGLKKIIGK